MFTTFLTVTMNYCCYNCCHWPTWLSSVTPYTSGQGVMTLPLAAMAPTLSRHALKFTCVFAEANRARVLCSFFTACATWSACRGLHPYHVDVICDELSHDDIKLAAAKRVLAVGPQQLGRACRRHAFQHEVVVLLTSLAQHQHLLQIALHLFTRAKGSCHQTSAKGSPHQTHVM